jgi:VanZ family protein
MPKIVEKPLSVFLRAAFIGCIIVLAILSLLPATMMMRTELGGHAEHFVAYLGTAILMGLTFQKGPQLTVQCILLILYAAALEAGQLYSPGRHPSFQDLAFGAAGVVSGGLFLSMARTRVLSLLRLD